MVRKIIDVGVEGNDATGDAIRDSFIKVNDNFNELYSTLGEGDGIPFTSLSDTPDTLIPNTVFMVNPSGNALIAKEVVAGEGIDIDYSTDPTQLRIISLSTKLKDDVNPTLGGNLNALNFYIYGVKDPNTTIGSQTDYAISKGYADNRYVNIAGDTMTGALEITDQTAATNSSEGALIVAGGVGVAGEIHADGLISMYTSPKYPDNVATKNYVDTNSYSSTVNFFVNTNGRTWAQMDLDEVPEPKRGRAHAYAFSTINEACQYAEDAIFASSIELGPYKQLISYNSGASLSTINNVTSLGSGRYRLQITNYGGTINVDQGNVLNTDLISGKLIVGATSNAKAFIYQYRGVQSGYDEIDVTLISGTFANGENLYFDNATPTIQITINVESGIYNEHLPIRVSKNVSIIGDELRRTIVRPLDAVSQSPWAKVYFYRDLSIDSNTLATSNYGYHYLSDITDRTSTPKNNKEIDMFLMNDATGMKDITFQGHGGFAVVLDPEGQILTKSPYIQNCSSVASSANVKKFRGGMFIDGFAGRQTATITAVNSSTELEISGLNFKKARSLVGDTETNRRPIVPTSFWINGQRYNVQSVRLFDDLTGTATIILGTAYAGGSSVSITLETAGNKSSLATHFTQVNDLGYGIVSANNALIELVSVFTYFCHTAYYAYNGGQMRSVAGSNAHGFIGLKAEGSDPLEIPRPIILADNLNQVAKVYKRGGTFDSTDYNSQDASLLAVTDFEFIPYSVTEIEINHPIAGPTVYTATSVAMVANNPVISTASRTGSTVTITTTTDHGFIAGDNVIISGVSDPVFDQIAIVLAGGLTNNQFTYTSVGSGVAVGTGGRAKLNVSIARLSLGTGLSGSSVAFLEDMTDGDYVILRSKQNFKFYGNFTGISTRPSTALDFTNDVDTGTYRTIGFSSNYYDNAKSPSSVGYGNTESLNDAPLLGSTNIISVDSNFNYVSAQVTSLAGAGGASTLRITELSASDQIRIVGMEFAWVDQNVSQKGFKRIVTGYTATSPGVYATITLNSALPSNTSIPIDTELFFGIREAASSTLSGSIASSGAVSTITLASTANFSPVGYIKIDSEYFSFTGNNTGTNTLTGVTRAQVGSTAAGHSGGATVQEITGLLTTSISTCRATSHDFLNIGTGGYNTTNYPNNVFGDPVETKVDSSSAIDSTGGSSKAEVQEKNKGRVFFMSTNQDGFFRVGRFFTVDQGTGSVSFNAGISLTNVDGLGFKRGITIAEFSNDASMPDLGDAVPTNAAVREYINRRLGLDHNGTVNNDPISPGFMPRDGSLAATNDMNLGGNQILNVGTPVTGSDAANKTYVDLFLKRTGGTRTGIDSFTMSAATSGVIDMNSNKITNLATPTSGTDAANKSYVDTQLATKDQLTELSDVNIVGATGPQALVWDSVSGKWINSLLSNASISASAAIDQSKLNLNNATAATGVGVVTKGIAGYNSANFTAISGFVSIAPNGVALSNLGQIPDRTAIANLSGAQATPGATGIAGVVVEGIKDAFASAGVVALTATIPSKVVNTIAYSSTSSADAIVQRDGSQGFSANGVVNVGQLNVDGVKALDTTGATGPTQVLEFYTPQGDLNIALNGSGSSRTSTFSGWIRTTQITTGATGTIGTLNGNWQLTSGSKLEATYADLAEYYEADQEYEVGAVLMIGGDREVTLARGEGTTAVAGIVSINPSYVMNSACPGIKVAIALQGRVPCKVIGKIKRGDLLVVSTVPGVATATKTPSPGSIIGKALNDYDSDRIGIIEIMVGKH